MQKYSFDTIGTDLTLSFDTVEDISWLFLSLRERLSYFEARFSRFIESNWLDDLIYSRHAILDHDAEKMLSFALHLARQTDGYFDPTVGKRLAELWYGNKKLTWASISQKSEYGDYRDIEIRWNEVILHGDIHLEFWGAGKGYLIDIIYTMIRQHFSSVWDIPRYLINFGWDLYGKWGWKVGLESPFAPDEAIGILELEDDFLACSAGTKRRWGNHHHLIDPHTGESAQEVVASYIEVWWDQESGGMRADAYATTLCVMPWDLAAHTLDKTSWISGVIVRYDGMIYQKEGSKCQLFS